MRCAPRRPPSPPPPAPTPPPRLPLSGWAAPAGRGPGNREVIHKLLRWTVLMFTAPFFAVRRPAAAPRPPPLGRAHAPVCLRAQYFVCARWLESGPIWAGVAAILVVQVVIFGYVITAFTEDMEVDREPAPAPEPEPDSSSGGDKKRR